MENGFLFVVYSSDEWILELLHLHTNSSSGWLALTWDFNLNLQTFREPVFIKEQADPKSIAAIILGGGAGTRLYPLTRRRAKPAVCKCDLL